MSLTPRTWRWIGLAALWLLVAAVAWLMAVQAFLVVMAPVGHWQRPGLGRAMVVDKDRDPESVFTDPVVLRRGGRVQEVRMLKAEAKALQREDELWVLDNYFASPLRPEVFHLTPLRLLLEYPLPLLLGALWGIRRLRRAQARAAAVEADPARPRRVLTDDFHSRADRFGAKPAPPKD